MNCCSLTSVYLDKFSLCLSACKLDHLGQETLQLKHSGQGGVKYASSMLQVCFKYALCMLQVCFKYAPSMLQLCFNYASIMLQV